jgi:hypothetical protein
MYQVNMPWGADGYSPLDFSLLDPHYGTLKEWKDTIGALHDSGMSVRASAFDLRLNRQTDRSMGLCFAFKLYESASKLLETVRTLALTKFGCRAPIVLDFTVATMGDLTQFEG